MNTDDLGLSEIGREASSGLRDILTRAIGNDPIDRYVEGTPIAWSLIEDGGWDMLGAPESANGAGATLRDLAEVARVWGLFIAPSPLIVTIMAKRWSAAARECGGAVSVGSPVRSASAAAVVPFGAEPGTSILGRTEEGGELITAVNARIDDFAPSLRLTEVDVGTTWSVREADEMRVVWAAEASGCAARMLQKAIEYSLVREQFGQPIGRFQAVKHQMANALLLVEQAETAVILATQDEVRLRAATRYAFDSSLRVIELATQVHGGMGFTWEMGIHFYSRHVLSLRELAAGLGT